LFVSGQEQYILIACDRKTEEEEEAMQTGLMQEMSQTVRSEFRGKKL